MVIGINGCFFSGDVGEPFIQSLLHDSINSKNTRIERPTHRARTRTRAQNNAHTSSSAAEIWAA